VTCEAEFRTPFADPATQQTGLDDDDRRVEVGDEFAQLVGAGVEFDELISGSPR